MLLVNTERRSAHFDISKEKGFKEKAFAWAFGFEICCLLDSNQSQNDIYKDQDVLIAAGGENQLVEKNVDSFEALKSFHQKHKDWLFGFLTYDLKNVVEELSSQNPDFLNFPKIHFFQPQMGKSKSSLAISSAIQSSEVTHHFASCVPFSCCPSTVPYR